MIIIRSEIFEDYDEISAVNRNAFERENESRLVENIRSSKEFIPEFSLVALIDSKIVGHILFSPIIIKSKKTVPALILAPLAVRKEYQNQGIGSMLVREGLKECKRLNHSIIIVVGHPNYYPRFGFKPASLFGINPPFEVPNEAFLIIELEPGALEGVSGIVEFPSAFDDV